jgi:hypothetical protein
MPSPRSRLRRQLTTGLALCALPGLAAWTGAAMAAPGASVVRYMGLAAEKDPQADYMLAVLHLALAKSGRSYTLKPDTHTMQQARAIQDMVDGKDNVDLLWTMTTDEREAQLIPIRIPLDKGLIGWRIALVMQERKNLFKEVKKLADMQAFTAGQEHDWPDVPILKSNGLPVNTSSSYEALFKMLQVKRFDYFPRSVIEIWNELRDHPSLGLAAEPEVVLHYPSATYFFVNPRKPELAQELRAGLEKAVADGSFDKLFQQHQQAAIQRANLKQRRVIELSNPLIKPDSLPLNRPELWFKP